MSHRFMEPETLSSPYSEMPYNHFEKYSQPIGRSMGLGMHVTALHGALTESKIPKI